MENKNILQNIRQLISSARVSVSKHVNSTMTLTYFLVGRYIVVEEQNGNERAEYSKKTLEFLGKELSKEFGKGFSSRNLALMKNFYIEYQDRINFDFILQIDSLNSLQNIDNKDINLILQTVSAKSLQNVDNKEISSILQTVSAKSLQNIDIEIFNLPLALKASKKPFALSWSHYLVLSRIKNKEERNFYEIEAIDND